MRATDEPAPLRRLARGDGNRPDPTTAPTRLARRDALRAIGLTVALPALMPRSAQAEWLHDPVVLYADTPLRGVLEGLGQRYLLEHQVVWRVFCAAPRQSLGLLAHGTQGDVLITLQADMARAEDQGLVAEGRRGLWRNRLVFAVLGDAAAAEDFDPPALLAALGNGRLAVPDPVPSASFNGWEVLERAGVASLLQHRVAGAVNTEQAAGMLRTGDATMALLHSSEAASLPGLRVVMDVPDTAYSPIIYQVALTKSAWSRHQDRVIAYLQSLDAARLRGLGLEPA